MHFFTMLIITKDQEQNETHNGISSTMHNNLDENAIIFQKVLALNCSMGNKNVLIIFIAGVFTLHKYHFKDVPLLMKKIKAPIRIK